MPETLAYRETPASIFSTYPGCNTTNWGATARFGLSKPEGGKYIIDFDGLGCING